MSETKNRDKSKDQPDKSRSIAEWTIFGVSSALLLMLVGYITYHEFFEQRKTPVLQVRFERHKTWRTDDTYYLPVTVSNEGTEVMEKVQIHVSADAPHKESTEFEIDFFPANQEETRILTFQEDPTQLTFSTRASFELPERQ